MIKEKIDNKKENTNQIKHNTQRQYDYVPIFDYSNDEIYYIKTCDMGNNKLTLNK